MNKSNMSLRHLPLPVLYDNNTQHKHKQFNGREESNRFRPPKYKSRYTSTVADNNNLNRSSNGLSSNINNSSIAQAISFRDTECTLPPPASPNDTTNFLTSSTHSMSQFCHESHFEQCFERLAKLGEGSFGEVFQVRDRSTDLLYAVKISKQLFRGEQYRAERLEEVRRYEEFSGHENCIRFIRAWEQYDTLFMQMELCRESLDQYLCRSIHIAEDRIWNILLDLLRGLKSLHDRNLIHLDIKLDNVLIDDDDTCKLADFGLVIDVDKANNDHATEGDSRYMAPEILQGQFSKAADIFSLGIAMLELACYMDLPANGPLWHELRQGKLPENFINKISTDLQQVIKSMMNREPRLRPTVEQLLAHPMLVKMQTRRQYMHVFRILSKSIRRSRRSVWSKMCNFKSVALRYLFYVLQILHLYKPIEQTPRPKTRTMITPSSPSAASSFVAAPQLQFQLVGSTPIVSREGHTSDFLAGDEALELSQQGTPTSHDLLLYSTPINYSKVYANVPKSACSARKKHSNNFLVVDDACSTRANTSVPDTSSLRRKKLFMQDNEED